MKSRRWRKRALSTIVTTAIILSAVAIMGSFVVGWANMKLGAQEQALSLTFTESINRLNEDFVIENVWYDYYYDNVNVTITNVGILALNVTEIKFTNSSDYRDLVTMKITDGRILVQGLLSTNVTYPDLTSGNEFNVVVSSERGNIIQKQVLPP